MPQFIELQNKSKIKFNEACKCTKSDERVKNILRVKWRWGHLIEFGSHDRKLKLCKFLNRAVEFTF